MSEESMVGNDMSEFLDEALAESDSEPTPPKRGRSSDGYDQVVSFSFHETCQFCLCLLY